MIFGLSPVQAVQTALSAITKIEVNTLLQLGIKVLDKEGSGRFLIQMGAHTFTTKSDEPLQPGASYWADMRQSKEGVVQLRRLHPKPELLDKLPRSFLQEDGVFESIAKSKDPIGALKDHLLQKLAAAGDKESFRGLTQLLLSLHHGVITLPFEREGRFTFAQMRKGTKKNKTLNQKSVEFYACMNNLGPVEGSVTGNDRALHLSLTLYYPKSVRLLQKEAEELKGFESVTVALSKEKIYPFWEGDGHALLDIKG
ncbi:MAG: hypothetical protein GXO33_00685 [Epsilonproteobacteria bacterium]|nr:hypothetical protein [Campylobacterota bacterium]